MEALPARLTLATLAAGDVEASAAFYERLGWQRHPTSVAGEVAFFATAGGLVALWRKAAMEEDLGTALGRPAGTVLACNLVERDDVDAGAALWERAGGTVVRAAVDAAWGGRTAVVADLDGHVWELAWNPAWPAGPDGHPGLPASP